MPMPTNRNVDYSLIYVLIAIVIICCLSILGPLVIQPFFDDTTNEQELQEPETALQYLVEETNEMKFVHSETKPSYSALFQGKINLGLS